MLTMLREALASGVRSNPDPPLVLLLPEDDARTLGDMVAFAACVLEFPVAYVPSGDGSDPFLAGVPLDVYECVLTQPAPDMLEHTLLKFSCPQTHGTEVSVLRPDVLRERLRARLTDRLERAGYRGTLVVRHTVQTLDRVAL